MLNMALLAITIAVAAKCMRKRAHCRKQDTGDAHRSATLHPDSYLYIYDIKDALALSKQFVETHEYTRASRCSNASSSIPTPPTRATSAKVKVPPTPEQVPEPTLRDTKNAAQCRDRAPVQDLKHLLPPVKPLLLVRKLHRALEAIQQYEIPLDAESMRNLDLRMRSAAACGNNRLASVIEHVLDKNLVLLAVLDQRYNGGPSDYPPPVCER